VRKAEKGKRGEKRKVTRNSQDERLR
jgi:hypothetical protein